MNYCTPLSILTFLLAAVSFNGFVLTPSNFSKVHTNLSSSYFLFSGFLASFKHLYKSARSSFSSIPKKTNKKYYLPTSRKHQLSRTKRHYHHYHKHWPFHTKAPILCQLINTRQTTVLLLVTIYS